MHQDFTIHQLRLFLKVAEFGSFSRAATGLAIPQPSISRSIARVESNIGMPLFERSGRGVQLTAAGERFHEHARQAVFHHDQAYSDVQQIRGQLYGEARIVTPESVAGILFFPLIKRFQALHPNARIRVMTSASVLIPGLLDNGTADIGIIADTHAAPAMLLEPLCREDMYLIGPKQAAETRGDCVTLKRVASLPLILNAMPGSFRPLIDEAFSSRRLTPDVRIEIDANEPLLDLILDGEGFSILPFSAIAGKSRLKKLSAARIVSPTITRSFMLVTPKTRAIPAVCRQAARQIRLIMQEHARQAGWTWTKQADDE